MKFKIDKANWKPVMLGDVVTKKEENDKKNAQDRFDRFVKVEHMDSGSLHLKRWSSQERGDEINPTFYKVFRKGQVLFPTRNPHLKRASVAPFDGICGEKTLTLEPNLDKVLPNFLPFLFHSENFYKHTTSAIIGSTNPHVRWRDVANYEFLLPPKEEQQFLLDLFLAGDKELQEKLKVKERLKDTLETLVETKIHGVSLNGKTIDQVLRELEENTKVKKLVDLGAIFKGKGIPKSDVKSNGIPCVRYGELYTYHDNVIRDFNSYITEDSVKKSIRIHRGDILFAGSGETISEIGKSAAMLDEIEAYAGSDIIIFRPHSMDPTYAGYLMNSQLVRQQLNKFGTGATVMHVYGADIEKIKVPVISMDEQVSIGKELERVFSNIALLSDQINKSFLLNNSLINRVF